MANEMKFEIVTEMGIARRWKYTFPSRLAFVTNVAEVIVNVVEK
jgi:hypothetical protein